MLPSSNLGNFPVISIQNFGLPNWESEAEPGAPGGKSVAYPNLAVGELIQGDDELIAKDAVDGGHLRPGYSEFAVKAGYFEQVRNGSGIVHFPDGAQDFDAHVEVGVAEGQAEVEELLVGL